MKGQFGIVKVDSSNVAEIRSWSINQSATIFDDTQIGSGSKTFFNTKSAWNGSIEAYWDETDSAQTSIRAGERLLIEFYPDSGDTSKFYGYGVVTGITITSSFDGMVEFSATLQGDGALVTFIDLSVDNIELEDGFNMLLEDSNLIVLE